MIGNRQIDIEHLHDRADQALALTQSQSKNRAQAQSGFNGQIRIMTLTTRRRAWLRSPTRQRFPAKPYRQASTIAKCRVIVSPIGYPAFLTGNVMATFGMKFERHDSPRNNLGNHLRSHTLK
jgi:hypothetical protein